MAFVVQLAVPEAPPLHEPPTLAFATGRSFESCTVIVTEPAHLLPIQVEPPSRSPMWTLVGRGVAVGVDVIVGVGVTVAVSVGVEVGVLVGVSVGVLVAVGVKVGVSVGVEVGVEVTVG